jgi:uncharacterized metal-binding protein
MWVLLKPCKTMAKVVLGHRGVAFCYTKRREQAVADAGSKWWEVVFVCAVIDD